MFLRAFISSKAPSSVGPRCLQRIASVAPPKNRPSVSPQSFIGAPATTEWPSMLSAPRHSVSRWLSTADADKRAFRDFMDGLSPSRKKFLRILNEYKEANFEHDTPTRFFSKILKAVDANHDGVITMEEGRTLMKNIGFQDEMTEAEWGEMYEELGEDQGGERVISVARLEEQWKPFLHVMWKNEFWE